jgi:2-polyprenyl-6-methoxyphenol hydroxylase-like FAD-dependent oxidoreductase
MTGRSMIIAGGMEAKFVLYPIAAGSAPDRRLTNLAVMAKVAAGGTTPRKEDWSRAGRWDELRPYVEKFKLPFIDVSHLIEASGEFWEYPLCDREPLPRWSHGRVSLLGDAAHPMYPVGSNGASQAILDSRCLADKLLTGENAMHALWQYDQERLPMTTQIVLMNRKGGPEGVIDAIERLAPDGFSNVDDVLSYDQRMAIVRGYASTAGFVPSKVNKERAA